MMKDLYTYCQDCAHLFEKKGPSYAWMCMKFECPGGEGFVTREHWEDDRPYRRCADINRHGACPLWEQTREPEETDENK